MTDSSNPERIRILWAEGDESLVKLVDFDPPSPEGDYRSSRFHINFDIVVSYNLQFTFSIQSLVVV